MLLGKTQATRNGVPVLWQINDDQGRVYIFSDDQQHLKSYTPLSFSMPVYWRKKRSEKFAGLILFH